MNTTATFFGYEDITLRLYLDISESGNFRQLIKSGHASDVDCIAQWEQLIEKNYAESGGLEYTNFKSLYFEYWNIVNEHSVVKAELLTLTISPVDYSIVRDLRERGYRINLDSREKYHESLFACLRRCENLVTRANMKMKELERDTQKKGSDKGVSFNSIMASLTLSLGFSVPDDITLCKYNEYRKLIAQINAKQKQRLENVRN